MVSGAHRFRRIVCLSMGAGEIFYRGMLHNRGWSEKGTTQRNRDRNPWLPWAGKLSQEGVK